MEGNRLEAVISMPSGVFKPYAGVSTAVLVFTKTGHGGTDDVWFYDMKADGFSLDDKRTEVKENDIPDIVARFHNREGEKARERTEQSFLVPRGGRSPPTAMTSPLTSTRRSSMSPWVPLTQERFWLTSTSWRWRSPRVWRELEEMV